MDVTEDNSRLGNQCASPSMIRTIPGSPIGIAMTIFVVVTF